MKKKYLFLTFIFFYYSALYAGIPSGYYNTATGTGSTLKTQLYNIIKDHSSITYDQLWTSFPSTDTKANGKVWDVYSDIPNDTPPYEFTFISNQCGTYDSEGDCYNREHSFPSSWFGGEVSPMYTDLFQIYPTDGYVNGQRSNYPFGEVGSASWTSQNGSKKGTCSYTGYTGIVFEPIDEYKGDFARSYFYMATRYENVISTWYANSTEADAVLQNNSFPVFETWFLNMLGEWSVNDPVSQKEIDRNEAIYAIQGNRNPYIDHPEYVYSVWGVGQINTGTIETNRPTPSGTTLNFGTVNTTATKSLHVKTTDITGDLSVTVTGEMFSTSTVTLTVLQANSGYDLTVTYTPTASGTHTGTLTISGGGLNPEYSVSLSGKR